MNSIERQLEAGQYTTLIATLEGHAAGARENALLGIALMRSGRYADAEFPLLRASILGDAEGQVEYGNLLRLLGRFEDACEHLDRTTQSLTGELQLRALRWWGVAEFQAGRTEEGLRRLERAWHGYVAHGDHELTARVTQSLAAMHLRLGNYARAKLLFKEAIRALPLHPVADPRLDALQGLLDIQLLQGDFAGAGETLAQAQEALHHTESVRQHTMIMSAEAELYRLTGKNPEYLAILERLAGLAEEVQDYELRVWTAARLADRYSFLGLHGRATQLLVSFGPPQAEWPPELWAAQGLLSRRRGLFSEAERELQSAARAFRESGRRPDLVRVLLHAAAAALRSAQHDRMAAHLKEALFEMLRLRQLVQFRPDLEELNELLHSAMLDPELAPLMEPVLDNLANLAGAPRLEEDGLMHLQITTLGRVAVFRNGAEVELSLKGSVLLLTHLAQRPGLTRAELQLALYPNKEPNTGAGYVRSAIAELREKLGREVITYEGPHNAPRYRLGKLVHVDLDLTHLREALGRGEVARALALYRGEFMPGVEDSDWVQDVREQSLLALTFELRAQIARYRAEGDYRRVVLLANQYLRADPYDREVLELRLDAAKVVASPQELARYTAELNRYGYN